MSSIGCIRRIMAGRGRLWQQRLPNWEHSLHLGRDAPAAYSSAALAAPEPGNRG